MSTPISAPTNRLHIGFFALATVECAATFWLKEATAHPSSFLPLILPWAVAFGAYSMACAVTLWGRQANLWFIILSAIAFRLILLGSQPGLSDDVYRYIWEGQVNLAGYNPFVHAPRDPILTVVPSSIRGLVNHPDLPTVYPPLAQSLFTILAWTRPQVSSAQLLMSLFDVFTIGALAMLLKALGLPTGRLIIYAWNPLPIIEFAQSAHMDALAIAPLALALAWTARGEWPHAAVAACVSASAKLMGGWVWALTLRRSPGWTLAALAGFVLTLLPFLSEGMDLGLRTYAQSWSFNGSFFPLLEAALPGGWARPAALALWASVVLWGAHRSIPPARHALWVTGSFFLLSPTAHPWYLCWVLPWLVVTPSLAWIGLSGLVFLSYQVLSTLDPTTGVWQEQPWVRWVEYGGFAALAAVAWFYRQGVRVWIARGSDRQGS